MKGRGKGRFRKGEGTPDDWTTWIKEHKAAELEVLETRRSATLGETSRIATTTPSVPSACTPVMRRHFIVPLIAATSISLPAATGMSLSVGAEIQGMAKADQDMQDLLREKADDDRQTRDERRADVRMSDANATTGGPTIAVPAAAQRIDIDIVCGEQHHPWVSLQGDTTAQTTTSHENWPWRLALQNSDMIALGDWYCNCGK